MIEPAPSDLLNNVAIVLREEVASSVPEGEARNQIKAASVIIRRIAKVWDLIIPPLQEENRDIEECVDSLAESIRNSVESLGSISREIPIAPKFSEVAQRNKFLQEQLLEIHKSADRQNSEEIRKEVESILTNLYRRNLAREKVLADRG